MKGTIQEEINSCHDCCVTIVWVLNILLANASVNFGQTLFKDRLILCDCIEADLLGSQNLKMDLLFHLCIH